MTYCTNLVATALPKLQLDMQTFLNRPSPIPTVANSLFTFMAGRLNATLGAGGLNCVGLLNIQNPVTLTTDGGGVVTAAQLTVTGTGGTGRVAQVRVAQARVAQVRVAQARVAQAQHLTALLTEQQ